MLFEFLRLNNWEKRGAHDGLKAGGSFVLIYQRSSSLGSEWSYTLIKSCRKKHFWRVRNEGNRYMNDLLKVTI